MLQRLFTLTEIKLKLTEILGQENIVLVSTKGYDLTTNPRHRNKNRRRSEWADTTVKKIYGIERTQIVKKFARQRSTGEYNFSYIKFAIDSKQQIYGVVHGKSSFHVKNPSDIWFYDFDHVKKEDLKKLFKYQKLTWYTDEILIIKNNNPLDSKEAYKNEKLIQSLFSTYD